MAISDDVLSEVVRALVRVTGRLARFCDRAEHNEGVERATVAESAAELRGMSTLLLHRCGVDPVGAYGERLAAMEARHPLAGAGLFDAADQVPLAKTWRDLQVVQARHDAVYHPDVLGLAKIEQLRHYTLHLAKLAWLLQDREEMLQDAQLVLDRITDLLVFGVKLSSVCGELLPDELVLHR